MQVETSRGDVNSHIIFVFPPAASFTDEYIYAHFNMCLGSAYTISYLVQEGFNARPFLTNEPVSVSQCAVQILSKRPKVVGFTVYDSNYCLCQLIALALKQLNPDIIIFFGGPTPSVQAGIILKNNDSVDICVRHEGEETCLQLLSLLADVNFNLKKARALLEKVKGITYRVEDNILENPGRDILLVNKKTPDFLDKYPSPYLSGILNSPKLGIITARGCNQHCVYCNCAVISKRIIATHSIDRVIEELDFISKIRESANNVVIYDDAFTLLPGRALDICHKIIENKIKLPLVCATRCDKVNEELLDAMKEAGFRSIGFALESAVPRILRKMGKVQHPHTKTDDTYEKEKEFVEKFKKYTLYAKKIGIKNVFTSIIVGLPGETLEEGQQTVNFIRSMEKEIDYYAHNLFKVYPGTPVSYNYEKEGIKLLPYGNQVHSRTIHSYDTGKIPLAPKSNSEVDTITQDKVNMKILALSPAKRGSVNYFNKIILCADVITASLISWLQNYLAVNGPFIQIYSDIDRAKQCHQENENTLKKYISPTTSHLVYYQTGIGNSVLTFTPFKMHFFGKYGITIDLVNTNLYFSSSSSKFNPLQSICIDREKQDPLQLHHLLVCLANKKNLPDDLLYKPVYPYFGSLCRWEYDSANCRTLETVIVDADSNVKTCWKGNPVGKVGMPFPEIIENLRTIRRTTENRRGCQNCNKQDVCIKCIFPSPLCEKEYCNLRQNCVTEESTQLIRAFDYFKEL
jgi:radical SAM superfamily enzyme YgiQ (UPF0313 family)